jgi:FkbM family methyltransferase
VTSRTEGGESEPDGIGSTEVVYRNARNTYWRLRRPRLYERLVRDRARLRRFVRPGSLVFDVGANVGDVTAVLLDIAAHPVAVEPNPELAKALRRRYRVPVECAAVGAEEGEADMHLGRDPGHSTVSERWHELHMERWSETIEVPVTTLDRLIERYGMPQYVKIDVEGYEPQVLCGLTHQLDVISFEFQRQLPQATSEALERLSHLGDYRFEYLQHTYEEECELQPEEPSSAATVEHMISELPSHAYGDIYAIRS